MVKNLGYGNNSYNIISITVNNIIYKSNNILHFELLFDSFYIYIICIIKTILKKLWFSFESDKIKLYISNPNTISLFLISINFRNMI